jgi:hypothetical protein
MGGLCRSVVGLGIVVFASSAVVACGGSSGTSAASDGLIRITTSQLFITVENLAGQPVLDVRVEIVPVGRATLFTAYESRLEHMQKKDLPVSGFRGRDGTPFNLRVARPTAVRVTAKTLSGDPVEVEVPWE